MANTDLAFVQLFWDLMNRRTGEIGKVEFVPQKPACASLPESDHLPRSSPEAQGVPGRYLAEFIRKLTESYHVGLQGILIARNGHVICEGSPDPYPADLWHTSYSMCKSFTGMAIGLLIDEGKLKLTDRASDVLSSALSLRQTINLLRMRDITIKDLLTMSTGVAFNETGAISGNDWLKAYFSAGIKFEPGEKFDYNSMNSFVLSCVVTAITGMSMFDFLKERLFEPMGIRKVYWEQSPTGMTKGGWGLYITREDAAKLGFLYQNGGVYGGERYLSEEWVREAVKPQIETGKPHNPHYGYHVWTYPEIGCFTYNGMLGQDVFNFPDLGTAVAINAGNDEVFGDGVMTSLVREYFSKDAPFSDTPLPEDPAGAWRLEKAFHPEKTHAVSFGGGWPSAGRERSPQARWHKFLQRTQGSYYRLQSRGIGLMPLIMQVVHYNHTNGIRYIGFEKEQTPEGVRLLFLVQEGIALYRIPVGFSRGVVSELVINGEPYLVGAKGRVGTNEDGICILTIELTFVEEAARRIIKIAFDREDRIRINFTEKPADEMMTGTLEMITTGSGNTNRIFAGILGQISPDLIASVTADALSPKTTAQKLTEMWDASDVIENVPETGEDGTREEEPDNRPEEEPDGNEQGREEGSDE